MRTPGFLRRLGAVVGLAVAGLGCGWLLGVTFLRRGHTESASLLRADTVVFGGETTAVPLDGKLSAQALNLFRLRLHSSDSAMLAVLRATDCFTCEDLGRQLRELQRAAGNSVPLLVATEVGDSSRVAVWLTRERVRAAGIASLDLRALLVGHPDLITPAALVFDGEGAVLRGVAHPRRSKNIRLRSFAEELGYQPKLGEFGRSPINLTVTRR
jgi:hypothetical protein